MKRRRTKEVAAAVLTLRDSARYSTRGARDIAAWLRRLADTIEAKDERQQLSGTFRARYICTRP
jgi:hypothetical protein